MPTRMIRDWTDSERFDGIPAEAERLFCRLLLKADDYGRFHADPRLVASLCFPFGGETPKAISRDLTELENRNLIVRYTVAQKRLVLAIPRYGQRLKQSRAKFPPPDGMPADWLADSASIPELPGTSRNFPSESESESESDLEAETEGNTDSSEPSAAGSSEPVCITIPLIPSHGEHGVTEQAIAEWERLYPRVDVRQTLNEIRGWCLANPTKRKTRTGAARFINAWLSREQNKGR